VATYIDCIGSCKSNYHAIMTTGVPYKDFDLQPQSGSSVNFNVILPGWRLLAFGKT
jgi:hypothetical protein